MTEAVQNTANRYLTPSEAAHLLNYSEAHLARLRMSGGGPTFVKLGHSKQGRVRYRLADIEAWLAARTRLSTSDNGALAI